MQAVQIDDVSTSQPWPPGLRQKLARTEPCPPRLAKKLARTEPCPTGLAQKLARTEPCPPGLAQKLARVEPRPPGVNRSESRVGFGLIFKRAQIITASLWLLCSLTAMVQGDDVRTTESWTRLSEAGFDLQQLDGLRRRNSQPLTGKDRQPMDALLAAVDQWDQNGFGSIQPLGLLDLLADTGDSVCRRVQMIGKVRQCLRIKADPASADAPTPARDSFQLTIFPDLDGQKITVKSPAGDRVPYGRFAVTVRAFKLPAGETEQSLLDKRIRVDGFHYRFWRYDSVFSDQQGLQGQIGALVIGGPMAVLKKPSAALLNDGLMWAVALLAIGLIGMGWWYSQAATKNNRTYDALPDMLPEDWKAD